MSDRKQEILQTALEIIANEGYACSGTRQWATLGARLASDARDDIAIY